MNKIKIKKGKNTITTNVAYVAGLLDGEGCIRLKKANYGKGGNCYFVHLQITNSNLSMLDFVKEIFGGVIRKQEKTKNKVIYQYYISSSEAVDMLKILLSFLIEKKSQAELAIEYHEGKEKLSAGDKLGYYQQMSLLKKPIPF